MSKTSLWLAALIAANVATAAAPTPAEHAQDVEAWRAQRLSRLTAPTGWLSLVGLDWLKPGRNTIGSAKDNDIVIAKAPMKLGTVLLDGDVVTIELEADAVATIDGGNSARATLLDDSHEKPTIVAFGTVSFYLVDRGGRKGLRIKDSEAPTRTGFSGLDNYPFDDSWRIEADWVAFDPPQSLEIPNVLGTIDAMPVPGKAVFERDGKRHELLPVLETPDATELFFIFVDRTSGKQTYGAGRFLYAKPAQDGKVVLDFNRAYNPPCAFTPFATCPLAPPENRLPIAVTAGEKRYRGGGH
ncbi:MAG TPA: DUF1684 domain-containing protein [Dokdonella sp.]|uniref:DUF1684 domain-containing protein n=1 Tax=Dokdonella sp. TaxID=2291710 RepID=UPI0025C5EE99|nr:DUF1684 domain-containing protein [Dokdonella sp.]MBX3692502.1 DUF1684 domain-containing protein [Dokdonella sp.]MCW5567724.1 DUF1684 domain-containing protein [Dokdonella sp.]HNR92475.1 DUF1684 domain-containing protein [Dokdonella sp.]